MSGARVAVRGLTWRPLGRRTPVLAGIDLDLEPGERVVVTGPSGAGKSTLLLALAGQLSADDGELAGEVRVDGDAGLLLQDPTTAVVAERAGRDTAFGPENRSLPRGQIWSRVREALRDSQFPYGLDRATTALSGGEGQRLALAGALALRPGLLLLDEPTAMLDPPTAQRVRAAVAAAAEVTGCTLVVVEHRAADWWAYVDRVVELSATGQVSADTRPGTPHRVANGQPSVGAVLAGTGRSAPGGTVLLEARAAVGQPMAWRRRQGPATVGPTDACVLAAAVTTVEGPSGAGKSTLIALLAGLSAPVAGAVQADPSWSPRGELRPHRWRSSELASRMSWLPQLPEHSLVAATVLDEVLVTSRRLHRDQVTAVRRAGELLDALGLASLSDRNPHTLSGGEMRRLGLAAALAHDPQVLLLDEPTVGQDPATWRAVVDAVLTAVRAGAAAVVASHDVELLDALHAGAAGNRVVLAGSVHAASSA